VTNGVATYTGCSYTNSRGSPYTLTAASPGLTSATATTTIAHGAASQLAFTTSPQTFERGSTAGSTGSGTITVQVQDPFGNPVPAPSGGYPVTLSSSAGTGSFAPVSPLTIAAGTSSASFTYHDTASWTPTLTARVAALPNPTATQVETVLGSAGSATVSLSTQAPNPVAAGSTATYTITVTNNQLFTTRDFAITSVDGLPLGTSSSVTSATCVTISDFFSGNTGTFTLTVPTSPIAPNSASSLAVVATAYTSNNGSCTGSVNSTAEGSGSLTVSAPATQLVFAQQPTTTVHNVAVAPAVTVLLVDGNDDLVTSASGTVTVAIGTNPSGGTLSGTLSIAAVNGVATFNSLKINLAGAGYTLTASSGALLATTSTPFNVT
jgi:hypothetical protein